LKRQVADLAPVSFDAFQKKMEGSPRFQSLRISPARRFNFPVLLFT
jgi:hypothetical protein